MNSDLSIRKVLIYRTGSIGDMVVALPCFHLIARAFPKSERVLLTAFPVRAKSPSAAVLGDSGLVQGVMQYPGGTRNIGKMMRLLWQVRRFHPDILVYLMPVRSIKEVRRDRLFFEMAGVRRIVGLPGEEELKHRFNSITRLYESEASRLARSLMMLGDAHPEDIANWDLRLSASEIEAAARALCGMEGKPLIACGPGCKMQANDWGRENWRTLLGRLGQKYPSFGLVMIGSREDSENCEYAASDWGGPKTNLSGRLSPRESAAVIRHAAIFVGPDSGPKHLAASVEVPCVCVFSARGLPGVWFPPGNRNEVIYHQTECYGCKLQTCILMDKKCIRSVTVDEVEQAVERVLSEFIEATVEGKDHA